MAVIGYEEEGIRDSLVIRNPSSLFKEILAGRNCPCNSVTDKADLEDIAVKLAENITCLFSLLSYHPFSLKPNILGQALLSPSGASFIPPITSFLDNPAEIIHFPKTLYSITCYKQNSGDMLIKIERIFNG